MTDHQARAMQGHSIGAVRAAAIDNRWIKAQLEELTIQVALLSATVGRLAGAGVPSAGRVRPHSRTAKK